MHTINLPLDNVSGIYTLKNVVLGVEAGALSMLGKRSLYY
jgi:hypothetical protein